MAIQVQGTTVIDDNRYVSGAKGITSSTFSFNSYCKTAINVLSDNTLSINTPNSSAYYVKLSQLTTLTINPDNTAPNPNTSNFVEQLLLVVDISTGGDIVWPSTVQWVATPTFKQDNRYFITLTRVYVSTASYTANNTFRAAISSSYPL